MFVFIILIIYKPPYSIKVIIFFSLVITKSGTHLIAGNFNIHINNKPDPDSIRFLDLLNTHVRKYLLEF